MSDWIAQKHRDAAERVAALLALPVAEDEYENHSEGFFDPWELFPVYGTYCGSFDKCAIEVLRELRTGTKVRADLGAEMFREMLCKMELCEYGSSPRVCFPTREFAALLPELIEKWEAYSLIDWGEKVA